MNKTVLIVEDDPVTAYNVKRNIEKLGFTVAGVVETGEEAVTIVQKKQPDIVLMDIMLKGDMDGIEASEEIHSYCSVPIIYMTVQKDDHTIHRAKVTEPYSYLIKPILGRQLEIAIEMALFRHRAEEELKRSEEKFRTLVEGIPDIVYRIDKDGNFIYISDTIRKLGYEPEELLGRHFSVLIHPEDLKEVSREVVLPQYRGKSTGEGAAPKLFDERRSGERASYNLDIRIIAKETEGSQIKVIPSKVHSFGLSRRPTPYSESIHHETLGVIKAGRPGDDECDKREGDTSRELPAERQEKSHSLPLSIREEVQRAGIELNAHEEILFKTDPDGVFTYVSPSVTLFGWKPEQLIGRHFSTIIHTSEVKNVERDMVLPPLSGKATGEERAPKLFDERRTGHRKTEGLRIRVVPDGSDALSSNREFSLWGEVSSAGSYDRSVVRRDKRFTGSIGVIRDITARKQAEEEIKKAKEAAERANRAKTRFLAQMSHDLRTPLNAIMGFTQLLKDTEDDPEKRHMLELIYGSGMTLFNLMKDLLDMTRLEFGKIELRNTAFSPKSILDALASIIRLEAKEKGLAFSCFIPASLPRTLKGDPVRFEQILMNLLNNAVKFTQEGTITLHVSFEKQQSDSGNGGVVMNATVSDTGVGIKETELETIFEEYRQGSGGVKKDGVGLGLSIVKQLVDLLNGTITVQSTYGKGSTFRVSVPFEGVTEEENRDRGQRSSSDPGCSAVSSESKTLRILAAEDDRINRHLLQKILKSRHWELVLVENGEEVLSKFGKEEWDLIILDLFMPGKNGMEVTKRIREEEASKGLSRTPIIILTAHAIEEDLRQFIDAGVDDYLTKPLDIGVLKEKIRKLTM